MRCSNLRELVMVGVSQGGISRSEIVNNAKCYDCMHSQLLGSVWSPPIYVFRKGYLMPMLASIYNSPQNVALSPAMPALKCRSHRHIIVHELRALYRLWRYPVLNPVYQRRQHIVRAVKQHTSSRSSSALANHPGPRSRITMEHARDAEEAEELVQLG